MTRLVELLLLIGRALRAIIARGQAIRDQKDNDKLHEDPAGWFGDHFSGGVHNDKDTTTKTNDHG